MHGHRLLPFVEPIARDAECPSKLGCRALSRIEDLHRLSFEFGCEPSSLPTSHLLGAIVLSVKPGLAHFYKGQHFDSKERLPTPFNDSCEKHVSKAHDRLSLGVGTWAPDDEGVGRATVQQRYAGDGRQRPLTSCCPPRLMLGVQAMSRVTRTGSRLSLVVRNAKRVPNPLLHQTSAAQLPVAPRLRVSRGAVRFCKISKSRPYKRMAIPPSSC